MSERENVEILRRVYEKWGDCSLDASVWLEILADEVRWRSLGDGVPGLELSGPIRSKAEVTSYFDQLAREWEMLHYGADELVAQGDRVVMIGRCGWKSRRTGRTVETAKVDVFRMRDGKVTEFFELFDTAAAHAAAAEGSTSD